MASHLLLADWITERFRPEPVLIDQGYPLGPHALVAGLGSLLGASSIDVFAGLVLAIPALTALVAYSALDGLRTVARVPAAALVALPYLAAAYLAQEAFKEPIVALFVLAFALLLARAREWRDAIPLGRDRRRHDLRLLLPRPRLAAGVALVWGALGSSGSRGRGPPRIGSDRRSASGAAAVGARVRSSRCRRSAGSPTSPTSAPCIRTRRTRAGSATSRASSRRWRRSGSGRRASSGSRPRPATCRRSSSTLGGALALVALALALPRWIRRHGAAIPAALLAAVDPLPARPLARHRLHLRQGAGDRRAADRPDRARRPARARRRRPLVVLGRRARGRRSRRSSFLILRQAPVAPTDHADELARIRPLVEGEKLLFLGRDNFVLYELRGSKPFTHVRNFYDPYFVEPNFELADVGSKFDFDSVTAETLARFPYVLTTRAAYASGPPPGYGPVEDHRLLRALAARAARRSAASPPRPGPSRAARRLSAAGSPSGRLAFAGRRRCVAEGWSSATVESGESATAGSTCRRATGTSRSSTTRPGR